MTRTEKARAAARAYRHMAEAMGAWARARDAGESPEHVLELYQTARKAREEYHALHR